MYTLLYMYTITPTHLFSFSNQHSNSKLYCHWSSVCVCVCVCVCVLQKWQHSIKWQRDWDSCYKYLLRTCTTSDSRTAIVNGIGDNRRWSMIQCWNRKFLFPVPPVSTFLELELEALVKENLMLNSIASMDHCRSPSVVTIAIFLESCNLEGPLC